MIKQNKDVDCLGNIYCLCFSFHCVTYWRAAESWTWDRLKTNERQKKNGLESNKHNFSEFLTAELDSWSSFKDFKNVLILLKQLWCLCWCQYCKITFWKRELWLSKNRISITVWKTWKSSRHYTPSRTVWRIYALIKKAAISTFYFSTGYFIKEIEIKHFPPCSHTL